MIENDVKIYNQNMYVMYIRKLSDLALNRFTWDLKSPELKGISISFFEKALFKYGVGAFCYDNSIMCWLSLQADIVNYNVYHEPIEVIGTGYNYTKTFGGLDFEYCYNNRIKQGCYTDVLRYATDLANIDTTLHFLSKKMKQPYIFKNTNQNNKLNNRILANQIENNDIINIGQDGLENTLEVLELPISNINFQCLIDYKTQIINDYLTSIGINNVEHEKAERLITDEVNANNEKINRYLQSALTEREEFCQRLERYHGLKVSVSVNQNSGYDNNMNDNGNVIAYETDEKDQTDE